MKRKIIFIVLSAVMLLSFGACKKEKTNAVECTGIVFKASGYDEGETLLLGRGETVTVQATVLPNDTTYKALAWSTTNPDIGVESKGNDRAVITAYDVGKATVSAKCGSFTKSIEVECVAAVMPRELSVESAEMTVAVTKREKIGYSFEPTNTTNKKVGFTVTAMGDADPDMVSVTEENGEYYVSVSQLAAVGDKYRIILRAAADNTVRASIDLTVGPLEVNSMSFRNGEVTLSVNDPLYRLAPLFKPEETTYTEVEFSSSDDDICSVDEIGTLNPKKAGVVNITAVNKHNEEITCSVKVTVTEDESDYLFRLLKKSDVTSLDAVTYDIMDFETDKVAFNAWRKVLSEDCNSFCHISDAGWAIWMVGFDVYDDDGNENGGDANAMVYCKVKVPENATEMQYVFRAHPLPDDLAKFRIVAVEEDLTVKDCTDGWIVMSNTTDMFYNIDVSAYAGKEVTFVVMQDQIGNKSAGSHMKVSLMFRRCLFNVESTRERWIEEEIYAIVNKNEK